MKRANLLDVIKTVACVFIVGSHCLPIANSNTLNFFYGQWFFRWCVPLFFIATGYFFSKMEKEKRKTYIKRIALLYVLSSILYLPLFCKTGLFRVIYSLVFGYHHLWYLSALTFGLIILNLDAINKIKHKYLVILCILIGGVILDEYYKLFNIGLLNTLSRSISYIGGSRHTIFFAIPMMMIGAWIGKKNHDKRMIYYLGMFLLVFMGGLLEAFYLKEKIGNNITTDVTIFGWMPAVPLFIIGLKTESFLSQEKSRFLRKTIDTVYIIHVWVIVIIDKFLILKGINRFIVVLLISFIASIAIIKISIICKQSKNQRRVVHEKENNDSVWN